MKPAPRFRSKTSSSLEHLTRTLGVLSLYLFVCLFITCAMMMAARVLEWVVR